MRRAAILAALLAAPAAITAQTETPDTAAHALQEVEITTRSSGVQRLGGAINGQVLGQAELFKAACCNLGESFTTNPSVDVSYADAATGAKQIKLLGLSGTYVQMLTENLPDFRGAATPYALGYVPGPWMKSIQVSKGAASVKNGYESITGQININYLYPDDDEGVNLNLYGDIETRLEANADATLHIGQHAATTILAHYENRIDCRDANHDGFRDMPETEQLNVMNRWKYHRGRFLFHGGWAALKETRHSGQTCRPNPYLISIETHRYEAHAKNALILNRERNASLALMLMGSMHEQDATFGGKRYAVNEKNLYAQLLYETDLGRGHNIAVGASYCHDYLGERSRTATHDTAAPLLRTTACENVAGAYAQYTYTLGTRLTVMAGLRLDHSDLHGTFLTPRAHIKWQPADAFALRASAGKGFRTAHTLAENSNLVASGRQLDATAAIKEEAWNCGASATLHVPVFGETLTLNAEYYYTRFMHQAVIDYDTDPARITIAPLHGRSYSHTLQADATITLRRRLTLTAAYRRNIVRCTYGGILRDKPLTNKYKALLTASWQNRLRLWQIDATLQLNGGGRLPTPRTGADGQPAWAPTFKAYEQLSAQITRHFRRISLYVGGENLTAFRQRRPIIAAEQPWSADFEPTLVWGPVSGAMAYAGLRWKVWKK